MEGSLQCLVSCAHIFTEALAQTSPHQEGFLWLPNYKEPSQLLPYHLPWVFVFVTLIIIQYGLVYVYIYLLPAPAPQRMEAFWEQESLFSSLSVSHV